MDTESLYVMYGLLVIGLCGGAYFLQSYISNRERKIEKEKKEKRIDELNDSWIERKTRARMSIYEFRKKAHLINPITFTNGITVSFVEKKKTAGDIMRYVSFGIEYEIEGELYYDILYHDYGISDIIIDNKYSLEDLEGYNWIIETAYNLTQASIKRLKEEKTEKKMFIKDIDSNEFVSKIKQ